MREIVASFFQNRLVREGCLVLFVVGLLVIIESLISPKIVDIRYRYLGKEYQAHVLPISIPAKPGGSQMDVWGSVTIYPFQSTQFSIQGDDCLMNLNVNGTPVIVTPKCFLGRPKINIDLKPYLREGKNDLHFIIKDSYGVKVGVSIVPSSVQPVIFILRLLQLFIPFFWLFILSSKTLFPQFNYLQKILTAGFLLRFLYVAVTAYNIRNYDVDGHIEYIEFVTRFWTVPPAAQGWSYHQGPLYYFLTAPLLSLSTLIGLSKEIGYQWIQHVSLMLSCMTLMVLAWCGSILFDDQKDRRPLILFTGLAAFFPGLIMLASRINNDALFQLFAYLFLGCLLVWWKNGDRKWLIITSIVIGLGFLTKANAYLFAPILLICIIFRPGNDTSSKIRQIGMFAGIVTLIAGWLLIIRYLQHDFSRLFLRGDGLNPLLRIPLGLSNFTTFLPWNIVESPYAYMQTNLGERRYFWMFFFRTALFGEFVFSGDAIRFFSRVTALLGMGALITIAIGLFRQIRSYDRFIIPLLVPLIIVLESAIGYVILHPSTPNQDFRFSILLLPIFGYFAVQGATQSHVIGGFLRAWLWSFMLASIAFILGIFFQYY